MKETIYTIPINEAFDQQEQCPICKLYNDLENDSLTYVLGAAMMEPDVRIETNKLGFCSDHFTRMLGMQKKLSLALILESHLDSIAKNPIQLTGGKKCYVCTRVNLFFDKYLSNIVFLWNTAPEFRSKIEKHDKICLPHLANLLDIGQKELKKKENIVFSKVFCDRISAQATVRKEGVSAFCKSFDHRFSDIDLGENKVAVETSINYLTGK